MSKPRVSPRQRFLRRMPTPNGGCWLWPGATGDRGHGVLGAGGRGEGLLRAHRLAFEMFVGPIPDGLHVCHHCDEPRCCNPAHLFLGTDADNMRDMALKGRGCKSPNGYPFGAKPDGNRWRASCWRDGREHHVGMFATAEEASAAALAFKRGER